MQTTCGEATEREDEGMTDCYTKAGEQKDSDSGHRDPGTKGLRD